MRINYILDLSDGVFDRSGIYEDATKEQLDKKIGWADWIFVGDTYELNEDGEELLRRYREDQSCGYDLCNGRAKGLAAEYNEAQFFALLKSQEYSTKVTSINT